MSYSRRSRSRSRSYDDASEIENPGNNLYVSGLSPRVTKRDLEKHFSAEGKVEDVHLVINPWTRESRGFGFVSVSSVEEADRCIKFLDGSVLEGRVITVEKARRRRGRIPTPGRYLGLRTVRGRRRSRTYSTYSRSSSETIAGAGHTLHITVAGVADHTHRTTGVRGPTLVLAPPTVDHHAGLTPQIITTEGAGPVLDLTPLKKMVGTILGLTAQKTVITRGADTIHQTTEHHTGLLAGAGAEAEEGITGLFLEVCLLPQGDITGATLPVSLRLGHGEA